MRKLLLLFCLLAPVFARATAPEDYYNAGMDLFKSKDYEKAVKYFHAAVEQRPDYWQAYMFLGESYYQTANRTEAIMAMQESLRLHPDNPELRKFMRMVSGSGPWVAKNSFSQYLPILSIVISLSTLAWTFYWTRRYGPRSRGNNPQ